MLNLNLLPAEDKNNVRFEELRRLVIFVTAFSLAIMAVFTIFLLPAYFILTFQKNEVLRELDIAEKSERLTDVKTIEKEVQLLNGLFRRISAGDGSSPAFSRALERVLEDAGPRISFSDVSYAKASSFSVSGFAPTRDDLIGFENKLKGNPYLKNISSPLSNIIKESNINFSIVAAPNF
jgi:hypothetical protein